jgi:asparagine synthase (glutamine-hydrolysing)
MGHGVEARVPFLDLSIVRLAMRVPLDLKVRNGEEKWILRHAFADVLPDCIRRRPKNLPSHSSGLQRGSAGIRLYRPLFARLYRSFGYDLAEPVRRDFSVVLEQHDLDLDRPLAGAAVRTDYTPWEHARDLAGAVRRSAAAAARRLGRPRLPLS